VNSLVFPLFLLILLQVTSNNHIVPGQGLRYTTLFLFSNRLVLFFFPPTPPFGTCCVFVWSCSFWLQTVLHLDNNHTRVKASSLSVNMPHLFKYP
jgi:hypothetical protein